ncbi:MAG: asparagine synthase (glutamine-hydrolyzing) [Deltaproteobacteria bacterium RBG_13_58_19]|nr:MAG: asparagine synthase (glutamine-hydrolyzing) [Deltaproteobacteria bacterium RBG_13_58_19]
MCGICGFTGFGNGELLRRMNATMIHRGPDDEGYYEDGLVHLGMRRLAIVDLEKGGQPVANEEKNIWVIFNGEIYNHLDLREDLQRRGHKFRSHHSDTETIVHLYEEYGDLWPHLAGVNGMFAIALWDARRRRLLLYRDRIGKKPLYWAKVGGDLIFGSELKAVLAHTAVSHELDYAAIYHYFSLKNLSAPATAYRAVKQLLPGHYLVWEAGEIRLAPYWQLAFDQTLEDITPQEAADHLSTLLDDAVRLRMQCDVPYGAYLSGGVDSSSVVALMCRHQMQPVTTFSLGYADEPLGQFQGKALDIEYARLTSHRLGTEHHEYILGSQKFVEGLPQILRAFDEPFSGTVSTFFLSILIHQHVKVALSGDGADELFGSYLAHRLSWPIYHYLTLQKLGKTDWSSLEDHERQLLEPFASNSQFNFLKSVASPEQAVWRLRLAVFDEPGKRQLLSPDFLGEVGTEDSENLYRHLVAQATARDPLNATLEVDQRELLANQVLPFMDRLAMAHSIEIRSPYLDYRLIEFANRLPGHLKIRHGVNKFVHKLAVKDLVPEDLVNRPKEGFVQPIYSWIRSSLKPWVQATLSQNRLNRHGFFRPERVGQILAEHYSGNVDHSPQIWNLLCFQVWYESVYNQQETG